MRAENLDIATLPGLPANGTLRRTASRDRRGVGRSCRAREGHGDGDDRFVHGRVERPAVHAHEPAPLQYADERLTIEGLEVEASGSMLTVKGELPLTDRAGEGELDRRSPRQPRDADPVPSARYTGRRRRASSR